MYRKKQFEDTKMVIRSWESKNDRHYNGQKEMRQQSNDPQNITQKTKDCSICCTTNKSGLLVFINFR